jgi:hypothetical protein
MQPQNIRQFHSKTVNFRLQTKFPRYFRVILQALKRVFLASNPDSGQKNKNTAKNGFKMGNLGGFSSRAKIVNRIYYRRLKSKKGQSFFVPRHF